MNEFFTDFLANFHLLRPWWLIAMLPAIVIYWFAVKASESRGQWHQLLPPHLASLLIDSDVSPSSKLPWQVLLAIWLIATLALAGPTWHKISQPLFKYSSAQIIVVDMSLSMYATDIRPNRLTRARFKISDLLKSFKEGDTGIVAFAGDAFVISPMTRDINNLLNLLPALSPDIMPVYGSDPTAGIKQALSLFKQSSKLTGDIYLVTDGITTAAQRAIGHLLANSSYRLHILAIGGEVDAPIKLPNGELLKDSKGNIVLPRLDPAPLKALAAKVDGRYSKITTDNSDIKYLSTQTTGLFDNPLTSSPLTKGQATEQIGDSWQDQGPYLLLLILPIAALAFRKGILLSFLALNLITLTLGTIPTPVMAANDTTSLSNDSSPAPLPAQREQLEQNWWHSLWKTSDQRAIEQFNQQKFAQAANLFNQLDWQGASQYRQGDFDAALTAFSAGKNLTSLYNQGNTLAQLQRYDQAIERYQQVLAQQPDHPQARANLELVKNLKQDQDNSSQQQSGGEPSGDPEPSADKEPSAEQEPSANKEPSAEQEPSTNKEPSAEQEPSTEQEPSADNEPSAGQEPSADNEPSAGEEPKTAEQKQQQQQAENDLNAPLFNSDELTNEQRQRLNQLINKVADDPSLLLKNKLALAARKRRIQRNIKKDTVNW